MSANFYWLTLVFGAVFVCGFTERGEDFLALTFADDLWLKFGFFTPDAGERFSVEHRASLSAGSLSQVVVFPP